MGWKRRILSHVERFGYFQFAGLPSASHWIDRGHIQSLSQKPGERKTSSPPGRDISQRGRAATKEERD